MASKLSERKDSARYKDLDLDAEFRRYLGKQLGKRTKMTIVAMPAAFTFVKALRAFASSFGRLITPEPVSVSPAAFTFSPTARHSSTFANNNVACRVGRAVLDCLTRGGLCAAAAERGAHLRRRLQLLHRRYPQLIADVHLIEFARSRVLKPQRAGQVSTKIRVGCLYRQPCTGAWAGVTAST